MEDLLGAVLARSERASTSTLLRNGVPGAVCEVAVIELSSCCQLRPRLEPHISHLAIEGWLRKVQMSQARPSFLSAIDGAVLLSEGFDIDGALLGLEKGSNLVVSGARSGRVVRFGVGRAGSFVTPQSSHDARFAPLLKPQMAQTQFDAPASAAVESAAEALILQSRLVVLLSGFESVCEASGLGRR